MTTTQDAVDQPRPHTSVRESRSGLWNNRVLIWSLAIRELQSAFKSSVLGWGWALIAPLARIAIYSLVFGVIFRATPPDFGNGREGIFAVWLFVGLASWGVLSGALGQGVGSILAAHPLMQKVYFPSYVATVSSSLAVAIQSLIEFTLVLVILAAFLNVGWTWLLFPIYFLVLFTISASVAYCFAVANVYLRDIGQVVPIVLQLTFFMSAIIFPMDVVPDEAYGLPVRSLLLMNPVVHLIQTGRDILYELQLPSVGSTLYLLAWLVALLGLAVLMSRRLGQDVSEMA